jgi:hypothetical protein
MRRVIPLPACFETPRAGKFTQPAQAWLRRAAPQHEGGERPVHFGETSQMRARDQRCRKNQPARVAESGSLFRIVFNNENDNPNV